MKLTLLLIVSITHHQVCCLNKYSKELNTGSKLSDHFDDDPKIQMRNVEKPFRMAKLNLLWSKAKLRLTEPKLKSLYSDLKLHDKEEIAYKHFIAAGEADQDGMKEAHLRKRLIGIMSTYDLLEYFEDSHNLKMKIPDSNPESFYYRDIFKDKRLNKLWIKAEMAGFTSLEMKVLKEEFSHHQDKVDEYLSLLKEAEDGEENSLSDYLDRINTIERTEESNEVSKSGDKSKNKLNEIRNKGREIKDGYDRLQRLASQGPNSKEFVEPKVQGLWMIAQDGNFSSDELESLRVELHHYEKRLLKLRNLHLEHAIAKNENDSKLAGEKVGNTIADLEDQIKKRSRRVEKEHAELESRIVSRNEL